VKLENGLCALLTDRCVSGYVNIDDFREVLSCLIAAGDDVNATADVFGKSMTAVRVALRCLTRYRPDVVGVLLDAGAVVEKYDDVLESIFASDVCWSLAEVARALILARPDPSDVRPIRRLVAEDINQADLLADVLVHEPLTPEEWDLLPAECPRLCRALRAVLEREGEQTAKELVRRIPNIDKDRTMVAAMTCARLFDVPDMARLVFSQSFEESQSAPRTRFRTFNTWMTERYPTIKTTLITPVRALEVEDRLVARVFETAVVDVLYRNPDDDADDDYPVGDDPLRVLLKLKIVDEDQVSNLRGSAKLCCGDRADELIPELERIVDMFKSNFV
jgi:hypothetical protein